MLKYKKPNISIIGLGKLGLCLSACFASKGFKTIGVDVNKGIIDPINAHRASHQEPGLDKLLEGSRSTLRATLNTKEAINNSSISFLVLPTPSNKDGTFSLKHLVQSISRLAEDYKSTPKKYHVFVIVSTVSPGSIERHLIPLMEKNPAKN